METNRLNIRKFVFEDMRDFEELIRDKMSSKYAVFDEQFPTDSETLKDLLSYFIGSDEFFAIERKDTKRVIGFISLNYIDDTTRNMGYCIHTQYQNNGFARETLIEMKKYAKEELGLSKLISGTAEENRASVNLLIGSGFSIVNKQQVSFVNDERGNPIIFMGCAFECIL